MESRDTFCLTTLHLTTSSRPFPPSTDKPPPMVVLCHNVRRFEIPSEFLSHASSCGISCYSVVSGSLVEEGGEVSIGRERSGGRTLGATIQRKRPMSRIHIITKQPFSDGRFSLLSVLRTGLALGVRTRRGGGGNEAALRERGGGDCGT